MRASIALGILSLALTFCSRATGASPTSPELTATLTEVPQPSPTLVPQVLVLSPDAAEAGVAEVLAIAEEAGWQVRIQESVPGEGDLQGRETILVDFHLASRTELEALAAAGIGIVAFARDGLQTGDNLTVIGGEGSRNDQVGFLAGVLTGYATRTQRVGLIVSDGDHTVDEIQVGFEHGLRYVCPRCNLTSLLAQEANVDTYRARGVDVVFALPGEEAMSALAKIAGEGLWVIQVGSELEAAGTVRFRPDRLVGEALLLMMEGEAGRQLPLTVSNGGIEIADLDGAAFSPGRLQRVNEILEAMRAGLLETGVEQE
jgi:hypothetical protein